MGACLSCLGLDRASAESSDAERQRLLDDPYSRYNGSGSGNSYNAGGNAAYSAIQQPGPNTLSPEEQRAEREALDSITRWASDQIVEIFPHAQHSLSLGMAQTGPNGTDATGSADDGPRLHQQQQQQKEQQQAYQDILLSMIPGDKSKRSIRIYPASRPGSSRSLVAATGNERPNLRETGNSSNKTGSVLVTLTVP